MTPAGSLRALLTRSIDYAGMFPPCALELAPALENQAGYVQTPDAWMLSAFVLPVGKFEAAAAHVSRFDREHPLRISALGPKTASAPEFYNALTHLSQTIVLFRKEHGESVAIEQLEMVAPANADLAQADAIVAKLNLRAFWEAPPEAAEGVIEVIGQLRSETSGFKLRTGGVTPEAFPTSAQIASVLSAAAAQRVAIKFTAGLHHPIRQFRDEVKTKMHGFLNVLGAGVLTFRHGWDAGSAAAMLEDEDAANFQFEEDRFTWRDWEMTTAEIAAMRKLVTSFGSCSFDEPREDLRGLHLL
jgi:hypothetical protein